MFLTIQYNLCDKHYKNCYAKWKKFAGLGLGEKFVRLDRIVCENKVKRECCLLIAKRF